MKLNQRMFLTWIQPFLSGYPIRFLFTQTLLVSTLPHIPIFHGTGWRCAEGFGGVASVTRADCGAPLEMRGCSVLQPCAVPQALRLVRLVVDDGTNWDFKFFVHEESVSHFSAVDVSQLSWWSPAASVESLSVGRRRRCLHRQETWHHRIWDGWKTRISDFWDEHPSVNYLMFTSVHTKGLNHFCLGKL